MSMEGPQHEGHRPDFEEPDDLSLHWGGEMAAKRIDSREDHSLQNVEQLREELTSDAGITRRDFLIWLGLISGGVAASLIAKEGFEEVAKQKAEKEEGFISKMEENTTTASVGEHGSLWELYKESGYYDLGQPEAEAYFYKAVEELNPDKADQLKKRIVHPNEILTIPVTGESSD